MTNNPLIGTSLHRVLKCLEEIQTHLEDDTRNDFEAAKRLLPVSDRIATAMEEVRGELNRRFIELRRAEKAKATTTVRKIALTMPGRDARPVLFDQTRRGIDALLQFIEDALVDGGAGIVALNHETLDRIAAKGWETQVASLREAAMDALTPAGGEE